MLIMNTPDVNTASKVWRYNLSGWGYSSTGVNGPFRLAATSNGAIVADFITTGSINASLIKAGVIQDVTGTTSINMATGEIKITQSDANMQLEIYNSGILLKNGDSIVGGLWAYPPKVGMPTGVFDRLTANNTLTVNGHLLQFISAKDASGNDCHVLGYY